MRRRPYSVILLDEVEKAHVDVHEIFFQVFDKGFMDDGNGRRIDFKNTLIILTTNVGTDLIMELRGRSEVSRRSGGTGTGAAARAAEGISAGACSGASCPFPIIRYRRTMLSGIVRLQLDRIGRRIRDNHDAAFVYDQAVVDHIVSKCNDPDSGGRMIDNIITNTLLPALSREFLKRSLAKES